MTFSQICSLTKAELVWKHTAFGKEQRSVCMSAEFSGSRSALELLRESVSAKCQWRKVYIIQEQGLQLPNQARSVLLMHTNAST